jgi:glutamyl-Q tRNA(Asp) synthetase
MSIPTFRFAPSPTGRLHLGHVRSALLGWTRARAVGGRFLLRIEDTDVTRARPEHVAAILDDLAWLGLDWDGPVLRQSEHFAVYQAAADRLRTMGLLYPCFATRTEIEAAADPARLDPDGAVLYPGLWRQRPAAAVAAARAQGLPVAWRLDMSAALRRLDRPLQFVELDPTGAAATLTCTPARWGDVVIARKETPTSYHLSVVVDDARQGVTHVTRGQDLLAATDVHRLLQTLLGLPAPIYEHHPLILTAEGRKLSKSAGDMSIAALRAAGWTPAQVKAAAA